MHPRSVCGVLLCLGTAVASSACPPVVQNRPLATLQFAHLRYVSMSADAFGRVLTLDLSENDALTAETLAAVRHLPHLRKLTLIYCPIDADGVKHLAGLKELEHLDLYGTSLDDDALTHVAKLESLKTLDVRPFPKSSSAVNGPLTDRGLSAVCELPNLETLRISGTFTDTGLRKLTGLKKLRTLEISSDGLTESRSNWLSGLLPHVEFE